MTNAYAYWYCYQSFILIPLFSEVIIIIIIIIIITVFISIMILLLLLLLLLFFKPTSTKPQA